MTIIVYGRSHWSLTEAARALVERQHRLIYLCDQGVVRPDLGEARGRGSSRGFSARNLLEFAVALRLRDLQIPVSALAAIVCMLRAFEKGMKTESSRFTLPDSVRGADALDLRIVIGDGRFLYVVLRSEDAEPEVFGGIDLWSFRDGGETLDDLAERSLSMERIPPPLGGRGRLDVGGPEGSARWRIEVSVTRVAQDLSLEA